MTKLEKRNKLAWILDALSLGAVLQYCAFRFLQSTMFVFYYSDAYKMITMMLLIVFGGIRWLYVATKKWKERDEEGRNKFVLYCVGAVALAIPFLYVGWKHDYKFLIFLPICCMCLYDMEAEKVLKAFFAVIGTLLAATVLCSLSGTVRTLTNVGNDGRVVAAYGIINTTDFASYFTFLLLAIWCGMKGREWKSSFLFAVLAAIISYLAFVLTDSRTVLEVGAILLILVLWDCVVEHRSGLRKMEKAVNTLSTIAFPLIGLTVIILVYCYAQQAPWAVQIDQVLSGRLRVTLDPYNTYGISPFGNTIETMHGKGGTLLSYGWSSGYGYLDVAYAMLAIRYGWIITALVAGLWIWMTARALKQGSRRIAFAMVIMAIHAFSEARILDVNYNIFLVMPFCGFERGAEKKEIEKAKEINWIPAVSGIALVGAVYLLLPHILSWLRTVFAGKGWNGGTAALNSLAICVGLVSCIWLLWVFLNRVKRNKRAVIGIAAVLCICVVGVVICNNEIEALITAQAERLNEEEKTVRLVQAAATQPVYVAEQEELYKRRFSGFEDHTFSTEEVRKESIFTDSDEEALGMVAAGGMYTALSDKTGLYSFDPAVIEELAKEGFDWTTYYSGRRTANLSDVALFNGMKLNSGGLELTGPCRVITSNMETDQFSGTYEVEFKLSGVEGSGDIGCIEVLGDAGERLIKSEEIIGTGNCEKTINYMIRSTPKVSYGIEINEGAKVTIEEIGWKQLSQETYSAGVEIQPGGRIIMTTSATDNHFNMAHFQLYRKTGEYLGSFGEAYTTGTVSGEYTHGLPSGYYYLQIKGNTNRADEWVKIKVFLEEDTIIHYSYEVEELTEDRVVVKDVSINGTPIVLYMSSLFEGQID